MTEAAKNHRPNFLARKFFHILMAVVAGVFVLLAPEELIIYVAVLGFIAVFLFEFIRLNTSAKDMLNEAVGPLLKSKEYVEASGLFWLVVAALISVLYASPMSVAYGLFILGFADSAASIGGRYIPSRKLYRNKTLAGTVSCFSAAALVSLIFGLSLFSSAIILPWAIGMAFILALAEMFSHPFDDNFTIMLTATALFELTITFL